LRVHCAALGVPVLGDTVYGRGGGAARPLLHARSISVPLYPGRPAIAATAPAPDDMLGSLEGLGYNSRPEREPSKVVLCREPTEAVAAAE
jgi:tRNA pseudouridine32 synthase/23S rRNA pseudouridine746 synthase